MESVNVNTNTNGMEGIALQYVEIVARKPHIKEPYCFQLIR